MESINHTVLEKFNNSFTMLKFIQRSIELWAHQEGDPEILKQTIIGGYFTLQQAIKDLQEISEGMKDDILKLVTQNIQQ